VAPIYRIERGTRARNLRTSRGRSLVSVGVAAPVGRMVEPSERISLSFIVASLLCGSVGRRDVPVRFEYLSYVSDCAGVGGTITTFVPLMRCCVDMRRLREDTSVCRTRNGSSRTPALTGMNAATGSTDVQYFTVPSMVRPGVDGSVLSRTVNSYGSVGRLSVRSPAATTTIISSSM